MQKDPKRSMQEYSIVENVQVTEPTSQQKDLEWGLDHLMEVTKHLKALEEKAIKANDVELLNSIRDSLARSRSAKIELEQKFSLE